MVILKYGNSNIKSEGKNHPTHSVNLYYIPARKLAG